MSIKRILNNLKNKKLVELLPLVLIEIYLIFTLLLFQFGPNDWQYPNKGLFWFFIIAYHIAFIFGYLIINKHKVLYNEQTNNKVGNFVIKYFWVFMLICTFISLLIYRNVTHNNGFIPSNFFSDLIVGLINPGYQYYFNKADESFVSYQILNIIFALASFIYTSMIPVCVVFWNKLNKGYKIWSSLLILFYIGTYIGVGTNKGIFNTLITLAGSLFLLYFVNDKKGFKSFLNENKRIIIIVIVFFVFSMAFFGWTMVSRRMDVMTAPHNLQELCEKIKENKEEKNENALEPQEIAPVIDDSKTSINDESKETHPTDQPVENSNKVEIEKVDKTVNHTSEAEQENNSSIYKLYVNVSDYLTQGYYGMSLAVDKPFTTTYGLGHSDFLRANLEGLLHLDLESRTYQSKTADYWNYKIKWFSFYTYWANDISYYGVIFLMFLFGLYTSYLWHDLIYNKNVLAFLLLPLFIVMYLNMPGNNMIFIGMQTFCAFWELSFIYFISKLRKRWLLKHEKK